MENIVVRFEPSSHTSYEIGRPFVLITRAGGPRFRMSAEDVRVLQASVIVALDHFEQEEE
jgi:hypothetical protein